MSGSVRATPRAITMIEHLTAENGALAIFQSGGCCDGTSPIVLREGELPLASGDVELGRVAGAPFYIDGEQYERWGRPDFVLDVGSGPAQGFSLSTSDGHLVTLSAPSSASATAPGAG
jgi:uncharacterized protein (DUF779 family)